MGGVGKGTLLREVDALDGVSARITDKAGIHFRILNASRGAAVHGPRAQIDRKIYLEEMQKEILNYPNLKVLEAQVEDIIIEPKLNNEGIMLEEHLVLSKVLFYWMAEYLKVKSRCNYRYFSWR